MTADSAANDRVSWTSLKAQERRWGIVKLAGRKLARAAYHR
jgi:hypothetical protein